jgi:predicted phosphodiesterase
MGCVHVPFYSKQIINGILELKEKNKIDGIVLAGDFLDMGSLSQYDSGKVSSTGVSLEMEYRVGNMLLDELQSGIKNKVFLYGNHEARYFKWLSKVDNNKIGDILHPTKALGLKKRGFQVIEDYQNEWFELARLHIFHGWYHTVNASKKHLDVLRRNCLFFHTHRIGSHREGDFASHNCGFLGDINSPAFNYATWPMKSNWANGFAIVHEDGKNHWINTIECVNNQFVYNGVKYG